MALLRRLLTGGPVAMLIAGVALVFPGAAHGGPTFLLGVPDPCPICNTVTFDDSGLTSGSAVTTQFAAEGVTFLNARYDDGSLGQSSAPGFSDGSLVNASSADIFIRFSGPKRFAAFAYADVGWDSCCQPRTLSAYLGGQLVASADLPLRPARFLTVAGTYPAAAAADAEYSWAAAKAAASNSAVQSQTAKVTAGQASLNAAQANIVAALNAYTLDYAKWATCTSYYLICNAIYLPILASDLVTISNAGEQLEAAEAQLQTDQAQLVVLQAQNQADQIALADALNAKNHFDAAYEQALTNEPGPGFIGFTGAVFDTLVLSGLGSLGDFPFTTVIDTLETAPEPSTVTLVGGALATLAYLRRIRRRVVAASG